MFSYRAITCCTKQRSKRKKRVFKLPPEVTHLVFYPLEEKVIENKEGEDGDEKLEDNKIEQVINEVLNRDFKNRTSEFYDQNDIETFEDHREVQCDQEQNSKNIPKNDSDSLSLSNSVSFAYIDAQDQSDIITKKKKKQNQILEQFEKDLKNSLQKNQIELSPQEQIIRNKLDVGYKTNKDDDNSSSSKEEPENAFRRGAHYFCTFPKRKPNPVTPEIKKKIGKQREFEGKFNYYAGAYSDSDSENNDKSKLDCKFHRTKAKDKLNDYNKYDFNDHFRKKNHYSDSDETDDPRYYHPYIPESTINPRVVSEKRCKKIIGKKNGKLFKTLAPKEHPQPFNYTNIYLPPKRFEKSIFYPPKFYYNLESEESFLKHPDSPLPDKVKKYNNSLFQSQIHFYDFDEPMNKSVSPTSPNHSSPSKKSKKNQDPLYCLKRDDYQYHLHYYDKNSSPDDPLPQDLAYARRYPKNYFQSMVNEKDQNN